MKNLSVSKKLIVGFGILLVLLVSSIGLSMYSINNISEQVELYGQYTLPNNNSLWTIRRNVVSAQRYLERAFIEKDSDTIEHVLTLAEQDGTAALEELNKFAGNQRNTDSDEKIKEVSELLSQAGEARVKIADLVKNPTEENVQKGYTIFLEEYVPPFDQAAEILIDFTKVLNTNAANQRADAENTVRMAWILLISCVAASVLITIVVIIAIRGAILKPVKEIVHVFEEISKGNMKSEIKYESRDEMGQMAKLIQKSNQMQVTILGDVIEKFTKISKGDLQIRVDLDYPGDYLALKQTIENTVFALNNTMLTINTAAEQVSTGASQVASGAQALAAGSTEQAASVEELTVSLEKIAEQATENSTNVKTATQYVGEAVSGVNTGNEHMGQLTEAMEEIGAASSQITHITKVIEDIAFQTNILALNAAIEAARAGNAGKGFAVVADEVRNLAAKSAEAAHQTAELIQASVTTVEKGTQTTAETAKILQEVGMKAKMVNDSIVRIDQASTHQAEAIDQIKIGLLQVSSVVQTNAATAEENSATSEEMSAQAATLREEVGRFKLNSGYDKNNLVSISLHSEVPEINAPRFEAATALGKY